MMQTEGKTGEKPDLCPGTGGLNFKDRIASSPCVFTIGVAGDSGSGKTTFTQSIRDIFGEDLVTTITLDDYHLYDREERKVRHITPLNPEANRLDQLEHDLVELTEGRTIDKPVYNHANGRFAPPIRFTPGKILILEGLHTFFTPALREHLDFTLFVEPDPEVKIEWKMRRDINNRGYTREQVMAELEPRERDYQRFIAPQQKYADVVVRVRFSKYGRERGIREKIYQVSLSQNRITKSIEDVDLSIDLFSLLSLSDRNFLIEFSHEQRNDERTGELILDGELSTRMVKRLETSIEEQTQVRPISDFHDHDYMTATEVVQLILAWRIIHQRVFLERCLHQDHNK
ncbi:phosphoribulokinase [Methanosphaerula palustris]|uniref:phosphoribulokinase n=1 Tax=Methanosphaerula palustris (strain ATCC BAA-1556 / DSM 19958 / E1-9c) TaxID=521011 RepID=B8GGS2_METPE|nr:phosphoribulokinase [Methanosphaerula palustris]ACL16327.1 phosphoribulokinase/uridine kinase [Methanosphaerula palustris E1-9c]